MNEPTLNVTDVEFSERDGQAFGADEEQIEAASSEYLRRWNRLVSTTNWEKGRIICQWRQTLLSAGAPLEAASDEAWSRRVGNVSPQHVGRLRRVFQRFGEIHQQFEGLYWSHFLAALDWHDAEMWLEGAVQSGWSVARMRAERWRALGSLPDELPREDEVVTAEPDEDSEMAEQSPGESSGPLLREVQPAEADNLEESSADTEPWISDHAAVRNEDPQGVERSRPFANLPALPHDLAEAFEAFKLAILNHKLSGWREVSAEAVTAALDALKQLTLAPPGETLRD
jgi:hypothetical protein